ncbi:MAG: hypothetical protein HKN99_10080 [Winogradskyella sp.]|nr:hypothetical protein [Winogradskyella sp.]MBT8376417.1 hypothetical protein [Bacteroidia bacterium]NNC46220.1 hypothetical protein [Winogradskyella sp.]NNF85349.1 hypothetical protein [Winogradskyella sp.]NNL82564.1 hypothetical protein [Winogradskyella sp.]
MKYKTFHVQVLLIALLILGCKNDKISTSESVIIPEGLVLNNGEKWIANEETHLGMIRIDSILKNNTSSDGKILGDALSKETSYIIKSCDMKGEAHDQLHLVLVPMLEEITDLKDVTEAETIENRVTHLKGLVKIYFQFFSA